MIDTVCFHQERRIKQNLPAWWKKNNSWFQEEIGGEIGTSPLPKKESVTFVHEPSGLRARAWGGLVRWFECSLPRLKFGQNGRLIQSAAELSSALTQLESTMLEISSPVTAQRLTRLDLVLHFEGKIENFIAAHRHCCHPLVRRTTQEWHGESILWPGDESRCIIYDKHLEIEEKKGEVKGFRKRQEPSTVHDLVRVEWSFTQGQLLKKLLQFGMSPKTTLDFFKCYQLFRHATLQFDPKPQVQLTGVLDLLALLEQKKVQHNGTSLVAAYCRRLGDKRRKQIERELARVRLQSYGINWHELLPEDHLPPLHHICPE